MIKKVEYTIEDTENEGIMLLSVGNNKYYIGESISIIFELFVKETTIKNIVKKLNLNTNSNDFNEKLVKIVIDETIKPIIKRRDETIKLSVRKIFKILNPIKFESFFLKFTFLFNKSFFYSVLFVMFLINLFFHLLFVKPDVSTNIYQFLIMISSIIIIVLIHEIGHAVASFHFKIKPKEIGFGLYFIFPAFYIDLTEIWKLKKGSRIIINGAGIYFQLIVNSFLIALFYTNIFNNYTLYVIIFSSQIICLFNLNPFFKFDGYWIYTDYFNIPNLRKQTLDLYNDFTKRISIKDKKLSLIVYAILYLIFVCYIFYRIGDFVFIQHEFIYKNLYNNNTSNITIKNWLLFVLSLVLIYMILIKIYKIYKTYFYEK